MHLSRTAAIAFLAILPARASLVARYTFDTGFQDSSGNNRHGTLVDAGTTGDSDITTAAGEHVFGGGAMRFGGSGDRLELPATVTFASGTPYTITFWARDLTPATNNNGGMIIGDRTNANFFVWIDGAVSGGGGLRWRSASSLAQRQADFPFSLDANWHHYAVLAGDFDGGGTIDDIRLYRDGALAGTATGKLTEFQFNALGQAYNSDAFSFRGQMDEVWVFDETLGDPAIRSIYQTNRTDSSPVTRLRILLLGGQSNADGRALATEFPTTPANLQLPQNDVPFYRRIEGGAGNLTTLRPGLSETSQSGPELSLGRSFADAHAHETGTRTAIIKYANGGTNLASQWKAGGNATSTGDGPEYLAFQQTVSDGLAALASAYPLASLEFQAMAWMQGESDADSTRAPLYQANLATFIADIRATYGANPPFLIGRLSSGQTALNATHLATIRAAQQTVAAADPLTAIIDTDAFGLKTDNLHFNGSGQHALGRAFAAEAAYHAWASTSFTAGAILAGSAEPGADPDADGAPNRTEFLFSTLPANPLSRPAAEVRTVAAGLEIRHPSAPGRIYQVQLRNEALQRWEPATPFETGDGETMTRSLGPATGRGIFRVACSLP